MDGSIVWLIVAALAFVGSHFLLSSTPLRGFLAKSLTEAGYLGLFSVIAAVTLVWLAWAYANAPYQEFWYGAPWLMTVTWIVMIPAVLFTVLGFATPNPTAVQAERLFAEPDVVQGVLRITRHPVMWGLGLWGIAHMITNGDLASLIFFGSLALLAFGGAASQQARKRQLLGASWDRFASATSYVPFAAIMAGRNRLVWSEIGLWRILLAVVAYIALIGFHLPIIGVSPMPH
jgi:uncharacterized membrane protein